MLSLVIGAVVVFLVSYLFGYRRGKDRALAENARNTRPAAIEREPIEHDTDSREP